MMLLWTHAVDVIREAMFAYAQISNGNVAYGIMAVTFLARLALLPLTVKLATSAAVQQEAMRRVAPELEVIRTKFKKDPARLAEETRRLLAREGVSMIPRAGCVGVLVQAPVFLALFDAVRQCAAAGGRFLWIRDISRPDVALAILVAAVTAGSMVAGPQPDVPTQQRHLLLIIPAVFTLLALWQMAAGVGLYWGVSSVVGVAQGLIVRRALPRRIA
jgi:YidC/Oxa1 family membrane protein insertase